MSDNRKFHASWAIVACERWIGWYAQTKGDMTPSGLWERLAHCRAEYGNENYEQALREADELLADMKEHTHV